MNSSTRAHAGQCLSESSIRATYCSSFDPVKQAMYSSTGAMPVGGGTRSAGRGGSSEGTRKLVCPWPASMGTTTPDCIIVLSSCACKTGVCSSHSRPMRPRPHSRCVSGEVVMGARVHLGVGAPVLVWVGLHNLHARVHMRGCDCALEHAGLCGIL